MALGLSGRTALAAIRCLPKHGLSRLAGRLMSARLPAALRPTLVRAFGRALGADFSEVRDPLDSFTSLQAFFVRHLAEGARPIDDAPEALIAPCDGAWGAAGQIEEDAILQVKGRPYSLAALLGSAAEARPFAGGCFATFYLSPRDYHRFHTPCAGRFVRAIYLPGALWPVNRLGVEGIDGLFAVNERIVAIYEVGPVEHPAGRLALVAVGATMVGKVKVSFDDLSTNLPGTAKTERTYPAPGHAYGKGAEWGRFEFGSTIVLAASPGWLELEIQAPGTPLRLGRRIGRVGISGQ